MRDFMDLDGRVECVGGDLEHPTEVGDRCQHKDCAVFHLRRRIFKEGNSNCNPEGLYCDTRYAHAHWCNRDMSPERKRDLERWGK